MKECEFTLLMSFVKEFFNRLERSALPWTNLALKVAHIVVNRFANNLAIVTNSHGDATQSKGTTGSRHARKVTIMRAGSYPLSCYLVSVNDAIRYVNLQIGNGCHTHTLACHNCSASNEWLRIHTILDYGVWGIIFL